MDGDIEPFGRKAARQRETAGVRRRFAAGDPPYGWEVDDRVKLDRFLILGTEGGTYYVSEPALTVVSPLYELRVLPIRKVPAPLLVNDREPENLFDVP